MPGEAHQAYLKGPGLPLQNGDSSFLKGPGRPAHASGSSNRGTPPVFKLPHAPEAKPAQASDQVLTAQALMAISNSVCKDDVGISLFRAANTTCEASASQAACGVIVRHLKLVLSFPTVQDLKAKTDSGSQKAAVQASRAVSTPSDDTTPGEAALRQRAAPQQSRWVCCFAPAPGHVAV